MSLRAKIPASPRVSKLPAVLKGLGVTRIEHDFDGHSENREPASHSPPRPVLKLHQPQDEMAIKFSDTQQLQQMGRHLIRWRTELERQQKQLRSEQHHWTCQMQLEHEVIDDRKSGLDHRERQIKSTEFQLMQLQNDIIDAQVALEQIVAELTDCQSGDNRDGKTIAALTSLRFEINERFEYLVKRWQKLVAQR